MIAASEYAGEVDARPITIELTNPIAPGLSVAAAAGFSPGDCSAMVPSGSGPDGAVVCRAVDPRRGCDVMFDRGLLRFPGLVLPLGYILSPNHPICASG